MKTLDDHKTEEQHPSPVSDATQKRTRKKLLIIIAGIGLSYIVFSNYHHSKRQEQKSKPIQADFLKLPAPQLPQNTVHENPPSPDELKQLIENEKLEKIRMLAPGMMYSTEKSRQNTSNNLNNAAALGDNNSNTQFMSRAGDHQAPVVMATHIQHPGFSLAQGTLISATLETQIASDLPGMIRAITSQNIYSEDGSNLLLPRGSRLIGQYTSAIAQGQERVFVVWQRVIRPDYIDIQLNSPGTDTLGGAGIQADGTDRHFWAQFGNALLLSIMGAGTATLGVNDAQDQFNSSAAYREALSNSFSESAANSLESTGNIKPTIYINQGKKISVFVARDLDFYNELKSG